MDNSSGNITLTVISQQLARFQGEQGDTRVGLFNGQIVKYSEANRSSFGQYQKNLVDFLLKERKPKLAKLKDRNINIAIPDEPTFTHLKNAISGFEALESPGPKPPSPTSKRDRLSGQHTPSVSPSFSPSRAQSLEAASDPLVIPGGQEHLFHRIKRTLGNALSDREIIFGLQRNTFQQIHNYPDEFKDDALKQGKEWFIRNIRGLSGQAQARETPGRAALAQPDGGTIASATDQSSDDLPVDLQIMLERILTLKLSSSGAVYNVLHMLGRINDKLEGRLDHPALLGHVEAISKKLSAPSLYRDNAMLLKSAKATFSKLGESQFKQRLEASVNTLNAPAVEQPPVQAAPVSQYASGSPRAESTLAPSVQKTAKATTVDRVVERWTLNSEQAAALNQVFGPSATELDMDTAVRACINIYNLGASYPFGFLLQGAKNYPGDIKKIAQLQRKDAFAARAVAEPFLRKCVLEYAGLETASPEGAEYLTPINLWHDPGILDRVNPLWILNKAYHAISGELLPVDTAVYVLADQKLKGRAAERLSKLAPPEELRKLQEKAAKDPDIACIARSVGDQPPSPSAKVMRLCSDVSRYVSGTMSNEEFDKKREPILKALNEVSYSWLDTYSRNPRLLHSHIENTLGFLPGDKNTTRLANWLKEWYQASRHNQGAQFFSRLHPQAQKDLRWVFDNLAMVNLREFDKTLLSFEPFTSDAQQIAKLVEGIEIGKTFMNKQHQEKVAARYADLGLKAGPRTIADGNCGFASVAMLTGDSPWQVRSKAQKAALDMQSYLDNGDLGRIKGDSAYKRRVQTAAESFREKSWVEELEQPGNRAKLVGTDPQTVDFFGMRDKPAREQLQEYQFWMSDEDRQYIAVAYGRPVFPFAEIDEGDRLFAKYVTGEGELKYCMDEGAYEDGLRIQGGDHPKPINLINLGQQAFAHWMPMIFTRKPMNVMMPKAVIGRTEDELVSLRQPKIEQQRQLEHLQENPQYIPRGQDFLRRTESPNYDESLGSFPRGHEASHEQHRSWIAGVDQDSMMSLRLGSIGPEAGLRVDIKD